MKIKKILAIAISLIATSAMASEDEEKIYLTQIINQLDALKPLIIAASKEQPRNNRVQFHYLTYRDENGKPHNGLLEDINAIKNGIQKKINQTSNEPRNFQAIKGDYLDLKPKTENQDAG